MTWIAFLIVVIIIVAYQYYKYTKKQQERLEIQQSQQEAEQRRQVREPAIRVRVFQGRWDVSKVRTRPRCLFIFGDNEDEVGKGGQAVIRDEPNSAGIPTKLRPYMNEESFYSDEQFEDNKAAIDEAIADIHLRLGRINNTGMKYNCIMFPESGLGTGQAQLNRRAPRTYEYMLSQLFELARKYDPDGANSTSPSSWGPWIKFLFDETQLEGTKKQRIGL